MSDFLFDFPESERITLPPTVEERRVFIESLQTPKGGWKRSTLEALGVPWPPKYAWKQQLIEKGFYIDPENRAVK
jgi:hypothetical protein